MDLAPQSFTRWTVDIDYQGKTVYYSIRVKYRNKNYILVSRYHNFKTLSYPVTRLFYDAPNMGAMVQPAIIEVPYFLELKEPYVECIQQHINKLLGYVIFS
jgi:hypothetical protein